MKKLISLLLALLILAVGVVPAFAADDETEPCEHEWVWVVDQAPSCADGAKHQECNKCGATQNEGTIIPGSGNHNWVWIVDEPAGSVVDGRMHQVCADCHAVQNMNTRIPANKNNRSFDNLLLEGFDNFIASVMRIIQQIRDFFAQAL